MISPSLPIPEEVWKDIPGIDGYQASDLGRIRSVRHLVLCANGQRQFHGGNDLRPYPDSKGYLYVKISQHGKRRNRFVHQLVLSAFRGQIPDGMEGCHNDGCPSNNRLDNLRWDTRSENHRDKRIHGTFGKNSESLIGKRFSRLVVESLHKVDGTSWWSCRCDCGSIAVVRRKSLVNGDTKSCGCLFREKIKNAWRLRANYKPIDFNGRQLTATEWERELGMTKGTINRRLNILGWSIEQSLTVPT